MNETQPQPKSRRELMRIIAESDARLDRITDVWNELTDDEQETLAAFAEALHQEPRP